VAALRNLITGKPLQFEIPDPEDDDKARRVFAPLVVAVR